MGLSTGLCTYPEAGRRYVEQWCMGDSLYAGTLQLAPSAAPGRTAPEDHVDDLLAAEGANQLAEGAVAEEQDDEPELDGPEVRPDDLVHQLTVRHAHIPRAPPKRHEVLEVVDEEGTGDIDHRLPHHVVDQRFVWEAIDEGERIGNKDDLGNEERRHRRLGDGREGEVIFSEHQAPVEDDNVKGDEKKDRRRQHRMKLMLEPMPAPLHSGPPGASHPQWRCAPTEACSHREKDKTTLGRTGSIIA